MRSGVTSGSRCCRPVQGLPQQGARRAAPKLLLLLLLLLLPLLHDAMLLPRAPPRRPADKHPTSRLRCVTSRVLFCTRACVRCARAVRLLLRARHALVPAAHLVVAVAVTRLGACEGEGEG